MAKRVKYGEEDDKLVKRTPNDEDQQMKDLVETLAEAIERRRKIAEMKTLPKENVAPAVPRWRKIFFKTDAEKTVDTALIDILGKVMLSVYKKEKVTNEGIEFTKFIFSIPYPCILDFNSFYQVAHTNGVVRAQLESPLNPPAHGNPSMLLLSVLVNENTVQLSSSLYRDLKEVQRKREREGRGTEIDAALAVVQEYLDVEAEDVVRPYFRKSNDGRELTLNVNEIHVKGPIMFAQVAPIKAAQVIYDVKFRADPHANKICLIYETL